jgi:hypothetical protein
MSIIGNRNHMLTPEIVCKTRSVLAVLILLGLAGISPQADARGGLRLEDIWSSEHIGGLPPEIRRSLLKYARSCGPAKAQHYFSGSLSPSGSRYHFVSLHFEYFGCNERVAICPQSGCLHQVYASAGAGYRLVFSGYVPELELKVIDGSPAIEISCAHSEKACSRVMRWNGFGFVGHSSLAR